jgi:hypothetical protein
MLIRLIYLLMILCVPKTCAAWADASAGSRLLGSVPGTLLAGAGLSGLCDDLRLAGLKLVFLIVSRSNIELRSLSCGYAAW